MDLEQADRRFQNLRQQRQSGDLGEDAYRVEAAKLFLRDQQGVFWMPDADSGTWLCNQGTGWLPGDPLARSTPLSRRPAARIATWKRAARALLLGVTLLIVLGVAGTVALRPDLVALRNLPQPTPTLGVQVQVTIASPADGSEVALGQEVAIESTIDALPSLQAVVRVELQVDGQTVDTQPVRARTQPDQTSLPVSLPWRPAALGANKVTVLALSDDNETLGTATIEIQVVETSDVTLPESGCLPDATFVADVTIPPGTAFPPGARMDKVWQVRNSGSCAWGVGYELSRVGGEELGAPDAVSVPPTAAGESADLAVTLWAPADAGPYVTIWQLRTPSGELFGPTLPLTIQVQVLAMETVPPLPPANLQAKVTEVGTAVRLTWEDQSDDEDAFRIYRQDIEASIGLAPAGAVTFLDEDVACGHTYRYAVVAFNAAGASPPSETAQVSLPPCAPADAPPTIVLTIVPTEVITNGTFTVAFQANDDVGLAQVLLQGWATGAPTLDFERTFTCTNVTCDGTWTLTRTREMSGTFTASAVAIDSAGQESDPVQATAAILPPE